MRDELFDAAYDTSAAINDPARDSSALRAAYNRMVDAHNGLVWLRNPQPTAVARLRPGMTQQPVTLEPFTGQGNCLGV